MKYQIDVHSAIEAADDIDKVLENAISITLEKNRIASAALTVILTDNEQMRQLNRDFRGLDSPTDVLSFPSGDGPEDETGDFVYLGDIAISVPIAKKQAQANGHPLKAEIQLLAIHGVLHLLGYNHYLPAEKGIMWTAQADILKLLGLEHIKVSED
jgi:probable rRNA maturation factor